MTLNRGNNNASRMSMRSAMSKEAECIYPYLRPEALTTDHQTIKPLIQESTLSICAPLFSPLSEYPKIAIPPIPIMR